MRALSAEQLSQQSSGAQSTLHVRSLFRSEKSHWKSLLCVFSWFTKEIYIKIMLPWFLNYPEVSLKFNNPPLWLAVFWIDSIVPDQLHVSRETGYSSFFVWVYLCWSRGILYSKLYFKTSCDMQKKIEQNYFTLLSFRTVYYPFFKNRQIGLMSFPVMIWPGIEWFQVVDVILCQQSHVPIELLLLRVTIQQVQC